MQPGPWNDTYPSDEAIANKREFQSQLHPEYFGKHVAFSWDGKQVVASAETLEALEEALEDAGIDPSRVMFSYIPGPDESFM
jgi:hypothetical protein